PSESFILPLDHTFLGSEDGENSLPEDSNEPLASVHGTDGDPQGTDDGEVRAVGHLGADEPALNVDQVIARFVDETKNRFRPDTPTAGDYSTAFRRFAKTVGLDSFSRKGTGRLRSCLRSHDVDLRTKTRGPARCDPMGQYPVRRVRTTLRIRSAWCRRRIQDREPVDRAHPIGPSDGPDGVEREEPELHPGGAHPSSNGEAWEDRRCNAHPLQS